MRKRRRKKLEKQNTLQKKKAGEGKYTIYGFLVALQYWTYEMIVQLGTKYTIDLSVKVLKMLSWMINSILRAKNVVDELKRKKEKKNKVSYNLYLCLFFLLFI